VLGDHRRNERFEHLHHVDRAGQQRGAILRHRPVGHSPDRSGRHAGAAQIFLQTHPWRRHLADRGEANVCQIPQAKVGTFGPPDQQERVPRHHLGETHEIAGGVPMIALHDPHRTAPTDIGLAGQDRGRGGAGFRRGHEPHVDAFAGVKFMRERDVKRRVKQPAQRLPQRNGHARAPPPRAESATTLPAHASYSFSNT
jgi:hypothetical protein